MLPIVGKRLVITHPINVFSFRRLCPPVRLLRQAGSARAAFSNFRLIILVFVLVIVVLVGDYVLNGCLDHAIG